MGWNDDFLKGLQSTAEGTIGGLTKSASEFIQGAASSTLAKIGPAPAGNQTAAQIEAGQPGGTIPMIGNVASDPKKIIMVAAIVAVGIYLMKRK